MNASNTLLGILSVLTVISCDPANQSSDPEKALANCPVVGTYEQIGNDKVFVCSPELLKDTISLPVSFFADEMHIIKLDNRDEALVQETGISVSENYILVHSGYPPMAFKLFDKKGTFIANIGGIGQGPGEYENIYDAQIDEPNDRIYLLPWQSKQLLSYDLKGNLKDLIPLHVRCPKAKFRVDAKNGTVSVVVLPFKGYPVVAWTQDLKGNMIDSIAPSHLEVVPNFSHEIYSAGNIPDVFDVNINSTMPFRQDSLYQYDIKNNCLRPVFTYTFTQTTDIPWHGFNEWPDHFTGYTSGPPVKTETEFGTAYVNGPTIHYIIDKKTGKGAYFKLYNDYFGKQDMGWASTVFAGGYYSRNIEPGNLLTEIENVLKNPDLSDSMRKKLTDLQNSIDENDNNYILIARMKK